VCTICVQLCSYQIAGFVVKGTEPVTLQKLVVYVVVGMSGAVLLACLVLTLLATGVAHLSGFFWQSTPSPGMGSAPLRKANAVRARMCVMYISARSVVLT
jgi:hypothetical protein